MADPLALKILAHFGAAREAQKRIVDEAIRLGFNSQHQFAIKLAFEEAIINAIKKEKFNSEKQINIQAKVSQKRFQIAFEVSGERTLIEFDLP